MIVDKYLNYLNEGKNPQDPSLPNPYDYQSLELDPNVTKQDLKNLGGWLKKNKEFLHPDRSLNPVAWLYSIRRQGIFRKLDRNKSNATPYTIIDNGKRVGIVSFISQGSYLPLTWASWSPGHNYAVRGTMKLLDLIDKKIDSKYLKLYMRVYTAIYNKNVASIKVAKKLKMKISECYDDTNDCYYEFDKKDWGWWRK